MISGEGRKKPALKRKNSTTGECKKETTLIKKVSLMKVSNLAA